MERTLWREDDLKRAVNLVVDCISKEDFKGAHELTIAAKGGPLPGNSKGHWLLPREPYEVLAVALAVYDNLLDKHETRVLAARYLSHAIGFCSFIDA